MLEEFENYDFEEDKEAEERRRQSLRSLITVLEDPHLLSTFSNRLESIGFDESSDLRSDLEEILRYQESGIPLDEYRQKLLRVVSTKSLKYIHREEKINKAERMLPIAIGAYFLAMIFLSDPTETHEAAFQRLMAFLLTSSTLYMGFLFTGYLMKNNLRKNWQREFQY